MLSILIPTYNYACAHLVCDLQKQCEEVQAMFEDFRYEIIVADDGSTDAETVSRNSVIDSLEGCRYEYREVNVGRAKIRNWLVGEAKYDWLLIIDSDAEVVTDDFVLCYWQETRRVSASAPCIIIGSLVTPDTAPPGHELRLRYEQSATASRTLEARQSQPSLHFSTFNFVCHRSILTAIPFDEKCTEYGYEDTLFGIEAERQGYVIRVIDNPLLHTGINDNVSFLRNTEAALRTLHRLGSPLTDYVRIAHWAARLRPIRYIILLLYYMSAPLLRANLLSRHPSLRLFACYKLGYYLDL